MAHNSQSRLYRYSSSNSHNIPNLETQTFLAERERHNASIQEQANLRERLNGFFMTPCEKWRNRRSPPAKLIIQILKVVILTLQLWIFGQDRSTHVDFINSLGVTLNHLYLYNWSPNAETMPYPPTYGRFALYTQSDFTNAVEFAVTSFNSTEYRAFETLTFIEPNPQMRFCVSQLDSVRLSGRDFSFVINSAQSTACYSIIPTADFKFSQFNALNNLSFDTFHRINWIKISFALKTVQPNPAEYAKLPDCYMLNCTILFDNSLHSGQVPLSLTFEPSYLECRGRVDYGDNELVFAMVFLLAVNAFVCVLCVISTVLCVRSTIASIRLARHTDAVFRHALGHPLSVEDAMVFFNGWYVLIVMNDVLALAGTVLKTLCDIKVAPLNFFEPTSLVLGLASLLAWFGVLRYMAYFQSWNTLILTMKHAMPSLGRFLICSGILFAAFTLCGYVVIGPYHFKMRTILSTMECLFALVNGDDMFATFANLSPQVRLPALFGIFLHMYVYLFVSLFTYVVLQLALSIIIDTAKELKQKQKPAFGPKTESALYRFMHMDFAIGSSGPVNS